MSRFAATFAAIALFGLALPLHAADAFDHYLNPLLTKAIDDGTVKEVKRAPVELLRENDRVLPGAFLVRLLIVKTNDGRNCKLLVQPAKQRAAGDKFVPMLLVQRYVTFKEGEERTVVAGNQNLSLFAGFRLSLDLGQIVPEELGGDIRYVVDGEKVFVEPLGKAKLYVVTKHLPEAAPPKTEKVVVAEPFEPKYFNGTYKLYDDGRRSGSPGAEGGRRRGGDGRLLLGQGRQEVRRARQGRHAEAFAPVRGAVPERGAGVSGLPVHRRRQGARPASSRLAELGTPASTLAFAGRGSKAPNRTNLTETQRTQRRKSESTCPPIGF